MDEPNPLPVSRLAVATGPIITARERQRLLAALDELRAIRARDLPELLRGARGLADGDAQEEVLQLRDDFAAVDAHIETLERLVAEAKVVDEDWLGSDCAAPGRRVRVRYGRSGRIVDYAFSGISGGTGTVSVGSPVGQALLGRRAGETVVAQMPGGGLERIEILEVGIAAEAA